MPHPEKLEIIPLAKPPRATVQVPGSKSITNRAIVLAALTGKGYTCALRGALQSEDTELMIEALRKLGFRVLTEWPKAEIYVTSEQDESLIPARGADLFVGNSGTTMRFLTAMVSLGHGRFRLDGVPRMRERPIEDLLDALRQLGVAAIAENENGCPPVIIGADGLPSSGLRGGKVRMKANISSQFLSGLLMVAPFADRETIIEVEEPLVSRPYVHMTVEMLRRWGFFITEEGPEQVARFRIPGQQWSSLQELQDKAERSTLEHGLDPRHRWLREYEIEPDASAASYFWAAAAIAGGDVTVPGLTRQSLQGDIRFVNLLEQMGCEVTFAEQGSRVRGAPLDGIDADMNDISDCVMTLAAVACFAKGPTTIRNVAHIRHKETDRLTALARELRRVGAGIEEFTDGLRIHPGAFHGAEIETYNDHRVAMSMSLLGLKIPGIVVKNPGCVAKTYPGFFTDLEQLRQE